MTITKILVPIDGSTQSLKAFRTALDIDKTARKVIKILDDSSLTLN